MDALVVYESMYGNTHLIASALAEGLREHAEVTVRCRRRGPARVVRRARIDREARRRVRHAPRPAGRVQRTGVEGDRPPPPAPRRQADRGAGELRDQAESARAARGGAGP